MSEEWKVGDRVAKVPHYRSHGVTGPFEVVKAGARKVVLNDGSEWALPSCREWGASKTNWYTGQHIVRWTDLLAAQAAGTRRERAAEALARMVEQRRRDLTWDQINAIRAALDMSKDDPK